MKKLITRFAPSPTGSIHIGNIRSALYSKLVAIASGGKFLLRIEDTDRSRSTAELTENLKLDLEALALTWDEEPLVQSQRAGIYRSYLRKLEDAGLIYPCFCSKERLDAVRQEQISKKQPPRYDGTCHRLSEEDRLIRLSGNFPNIWRFDTQKVRQAQYSDLIKGEIKFDNENLDDFILCRQDGTFSFIFANIVDDIESGVNLVLRGEDHISNTFKQILLGKAFGVDISYAHTSLIVGDDNKPLSKRENHSSVQNLLDEGYLPTAIINFLARLGTNISDNSLLSIPELAEHLRIEKISKNNVKFDLQALIYWQKKAMSASVGDFVARFEAKFGKIGAGLVRDEDIFLKIVKESVVVFEDMKKILDILHFSHKNSTMENRVLLRQARQIIGESTSWQEFLEQMKSTSGLSGKELFSPLRDVISGGMAMGSLADWYLVLGRNEVIHRIENFIKG